MKKGIIVMGLGILTGCTPYATEFECGVGKGMKCASMTKVNQAIDRKQLAIREDDQNRSPAQVREIEIWTAPEVEDSNKVRPGKTIYVR